MSFLSIYLHIQQHYKEAILVFQSHFKFSLNKPEVIQPVQKGHTIYHFHIQFYFLDCTIDLLIPDFHLLQILSHLNVRFRPYSLHAIQPQKLTFHFLLWYFINMILPKPHFLITYYFENYLTMAISRNHCISYRRNYQNRHESRFIAYVFPFVSCFDAYLRRDPE